MDGRLTEVDKKVRDQAIRNLTAFVSRGDAESSESGGYTPLSDDEMSKLWKGLFYCMSPISAATSPTVPIARHGLACG